MQICPKLNEMRSKFRLCRISKLPIFDPYNCSCYSPGVHEIGNMLMKVSLTSAILSLVVFAVFSVFNIDPFASNTSTDFNALKSNAAILDLAITKRRTYVSNFVFICLISELNVLRCVQCYKFGSTDELVAASNTTNTSSIVHSKALPMLTFKRSLRLVEWLRAAVDFFICESDTYASI